MTCIKMTNDLVNCQLSQRSYKHSFQAILHVVVWYSGPGQYNNHSNGLESDMEEDNQALVNLERNIANLERSLSTSQLGKGDLSSILNRQVLYVGR